MAKDKISDYSTSAASNTDIGGIGIQGTNLPSNFDNAFREIMSQLAKMNAGTSPLYDTTSFCDPSDNTKIFRLDAGSISTATTRTITVPNASGTMALLNQTQTWTGVQTFATGTVVSGAGFTTFNITSTGAATDPILSLNAVGGSWAILNDNDASNVLDFRWASDSKYRFATTGTFSIEGTVPEIEFLDDDSGARCVISANSTAGSLFLSADANNTVVGSSMTFSVDGTEKSRFGDSYIQTWGGLTAIIDPTAGSTDGMTLSSAYRLVRSVDGYQPFQQRRRNSDGVIQEFYRGTALVGSISVTGSATAFNTSSDERLKHDFQPINPAVLDAINVYDFAWNADDSRSYGVKAQELEPVVPNAVYKGEDPDNDMWSVDYSKLVPILIAALQDARRRLADLEAGA